jgi:acyl-CoA synthetase (AMP-forming)/AMP-acid ligase II
VHPGVFAAKEPDRPAVIMAASGAVVTYAELEARSNQVAWLARRSGLRPGDGLAAITENRPELLDLAWGAQRSGLQFTAVNWHLTAAEAGYVVTDSGARVVVVSSRLAGLAAQLGPVLAPGVRRLMIGDTIPGWESYQDAAYDLASLRWAVHAAAPCPVPVKQAMIDWWGPILFEFYSMTEGSTTTHPTATAATTAAPTALTGHRRLRLMGREGPGLPCGPPAAELPLKSPAGISGSGGANTRTIPA